MKTTINIVMDKTIIQVVYWKFCSFLIKSFDIKLK